MSKIHIENIFIDLDGTTLKSDGNITNQTIDTIKQAREKNINIFVVTGRLPYMIKRELNQLNVNENVICANGGIIINSLTNNILSMNKINYNLSKEIESFLKINKIQYLIYTDKSIYSNCELNNSFVQHMNSKIAYLDDEFKWEIRHIDEQFNFNDHNIIKFIIPTLTLSDERIKKINEFYQKSKNQFTLIASQKNLLDIIPAHSSKGEGIKYLARLLSLNLDKSIAFGDADNDVSMFKIVKHSVAMDNAVKNIKKIATHVTKSNDNDGVSFFIKENIL